MKKYIIGIVILVILGIGSYFGYEAYWASKIRTTPLVESSAASSTSYTLADVSAHKSATDCWTAVSGRVYNLTSFIPSHPGGNAILPACGNDGTSLFNSVPQHERENAFAILSLYQIGTLTQ